MSTIIQRLYDAMLMIQAKERKQVELEAALRLAMPYYDTDYYGDWSMEELTKKILEICDG